MECSRLALLADASIVHDRSGTRQNDQAEFSTLRA
jgi:hypothetical protein